MKTIALLFLLATLLVAQNKQGVFAEQNVSSENKQGVFAEQNVSSENNNTTIPTIAKQIIPLRNPAVYSALGDVIYGNFQKIELLKEIEKYSKLKEKIDTYVKEVNSVKKIGYAIESGDKTLDKEEYLEKLRVLSKTNDYFQRTVIDSFKSSMIDEDNNLFSKTINSGLIDSDKYKSKILEYYFAHCADINATGVIQRYLDEDAKLKKKEAKSKRTRITKKQIQEAKIRRIREKDKLKQETLHKTLEEELIQKKKDIRKEQVEELAK